MTNLTEKIVALLICLAPMPGIADKRALILGDSNTWGSNPSGPRYDATIRWGSQIDQALPDITVIEDGLIGRRTDLGAGKLLDNIDRAVSSDLPTLVSQHMPLDLVIIMLGTNDLSGESVPEPETVARSVFSLARILRAGGVGKVLVLSPPPLTEPATGALGHLFGKAQPVSEQLADAYKRLSKKTGIAMFDVSSVTRADGRDGVHLTANAHSKLSRALIPVVSNILE